MNYDPEGAGEPSEYNTDQARLEDPDQWTPLQLYVLVVHDELYDHGVIGVYTTEQLARDAANEVWTKTAASYFFRIDVCELDKVYENVFPYNNSSRYAKAKRARVGEVPIELNPKDVPDA